MVARTVYTATTRPARDLSLTLEGLSQRVSSTERRLNSPLSTLTLDAMTERIAALEARVTALAQRIGEP